MSLLDLKELMYKGLSRAEAIKIANVIQQRAETERREAAERDAREGIQYDEPAASPWRTDEPPKDGKPFLAQLNRYSDPSDNFDIVCYPRNWIGEYWASHNFTNLRREHIVAWAAINPYIKEEVQSNG